jgi:AraC-like DNA-binding protein
MRLSPMSPSSSYPATPVPRQWNLVYGGFADQGLAIEWQQFHALSDIQTVEQFEGRCLELSLNLEGSGEVKADSDVLLIHSHSLSARLMRDETTETRRYGNQDHRYLRIRVAPAYLRTLLGTSDWLLQAWVREFIQESDPTPQSRTINQPIPLSLDAERLFGEIVQPPVGPHAAELWYRGKVIEFLARCLCEQTDHFCSRQKRLAMERVEKASAIIRQNLEAVPSLSELGKLTGCSPAYLSRTFSAETGMTVSRFIRQVRIERAAELLKDGRRNVTEVAMEVGYSSLSHFSKTFREVTGCCPGLYPLGNQTHVGRV